MQKRLKQLILCSLLVLIPGGYVVAQGTAEEMYLDELLSARHLPKYMHQDLDSGLSELVNNPSPYLTLIDNALVFPVDEALDTYADVQVRYSRLIGLLESIGTEDARLILERAYNEVVADMDILNTRYQAALTDGLAEEERLALSRDADAAYSIWVSIVYVFKRLGDDRLLNDLLSRYEGFNEITRLAVSTYNDEVGDGVIAEGVVNAIAGWHMVGMPIEPFEPAYQSVYEGLTLEGTPWQWTDSGYEPVMDLAMGEAYWLDALAEGSARFLGVENRSLTFPAFSPGWHNLAGPSCDYPVADLIAAYPEVDPDLIYEWQPIDGYVPVREGDIIQQGRGFWVFLSEGATLTMTCPEEGDAPGKSIAPVAAFSPAENGVSVDPGDEQYRPVSILVFRKPASRIGASVV